MHKTYKCLSQQEFMHGKYKLIAIRNEDKYAIMKWRNEQIDILRQKELLTKEKQNFYFRNVVDKLFDQEKPDQLLFSFLENDRLIGYGGLVHIDWESRNAEISFLTATERNADDKLFSKDFSNYLHIILSISFYYLKFIKVHTTFYEISQRHLYKSIVKEFNFIREAKLKNHILINGKITNVLIYSCFGKN
ncbi:MAG: hypothetical protein A3H98_01030 [Bacteroidetes bacterium RIFCSPLOWO2_02_FULL_36_8]|nr:MAG: hypothetical protein A3H98_01030 [Bacteroidetes bacterium RIFCSPLOWO2_02_FULL_36_8]OFY71044.1 MAG: hypothetical protein A3G23_12940 [Bacteroidetes bacterium RIFCSPLOWO2_12_FULL_37_12]